MSGFLHQLAARSLGLAPQIKSRAALPYAAPTVELAMTETGGHEPPLAALKIERHEDESPVGHVRRSNHEMEGALPLPVVTENPERATSVARQAPHPAADDITNLPARASRQQLPQDNRLDIGHRNQPAPPSFDTIASPAVAHLKPPQRLPEPAPDARHPGDAMPARLADLETLVTRLLGDAQNQPGSSPESAPPPAATMSRAGSQPQEASSTIHALASREPPAVKAQIETAPEVHITIGRLEVNPPSRPVAAAPPPRPRGPAPLSLTDYLARRNGGRS